MHCNLLVVDQTKAQQRVVSVRPTAPVRTPTAATPVCAQPCGCLPEPSERAMRTRGTEGLESHLPTSSLPCCWQGGTLATPGKGTCVRLCLSVQPCCCVGGGQTRPQVRSWGSGATCCCWCQGSRQQGGQRLRVCGETLPPLPSQDLLGRCPEAAGQSSKLMRRGASWWHLFRERGG